MAEADLDAVIRQLAKQQNKTLLATAKARRDRFLGLAAKAKTKDAREGFRQLAKDAMTLGAAAANRLQISADNAADSYARSMRQAAEAVAAQQAAEKQKAAEVKASAKTAPAAKTPKGNAAKRKAAKNGAAKSKAPKGKPAKT